MRFQTKTERDAIALYWSLADRYFIVEAVDDITIDCDMIDCDRVRAEVRHIASQHNAIEIVRS